MTRSGDDRSENPSVDRQRLRSGASDVATAKPLRLTREQATRIAARMANEGCSRREACALVLFEDS